VEVEEEVEVEVEVEVEAEVEVEVIRLTKGTTRFWRCGAGSGSAVPAVIALLACCCFCCSHADQRVVERTVHFSILV